MKVRELIELLSKHEPDRVVVMSRDAEGNGYSPLARMWTGAYRAQATWSGEVGLERLTPEAKDEGYTEFDVISGEPALVLSPVN